MSKDRSERKMYHKSPGRQYGYDYDPLRGQSGQTGHQQGEQTTQDERSQRISTQFVQRPDPRRTRQLTRKSILASKGRATVEEQQAEQFTEEEVYESPTRRIVDEDEDDPTFYSHRRQVRDDIAQPRLPSTRTLLETGEDDDFADEALYDEEQYQDVDPDQGYDEEPDPMGVRLGYASVPRAVQAASRTRQLIETEEEYDDDYEDVEPDRPRKRGKKVSRRGVLFGLGAVAIGGASVAAYELAPKIPGVVNGAASNIEHQLEDAFNKGLTQGADNARKELLTALQNLEGFTLDGAINAAKLTRVAYDVFVSPVVKVGAVITGDFLGSMLGAVTNARKYLKAAFLDNGTLEAVQTVLQSWVSQVSSIPQQLDAITNTDLDGAQSYLKALEAKVKAEQAKLNQSGTPVPTPTSPQKTK